MFVSRNKYRICNVIILAMNCFLFDFFLCCRDLERDLSLSEDSEDEGAVKVSFRQSIYVLGSCREAREEKLEASTETFLFALIKKF